MDQPTDTPATDTPAGGEEEKEGAAEETPEAGAGEEGGETPAAE